MLKMKAATLLAAGLLGAGAALMSGGLVQATSPARATIAPYHFDLPDFKVFSKDGKDVVMTQVVIPVGGSTGWHMHPGPAFVLVTAGTLTRYEGSDPSCTGQSYVAGTGFVEAPGDIHIARNQGSTTVVVSVTYLNVPVAGAVRTSVPSPGNCPF